jgi:hypothetical protein
MKNRMRKSELFFIIISLLMTVGSLGLIYSGTSLLKFNPEVPEDPFASNYKQAPLPTPTPTPEPTPVLSPTPILDATGIPVAVKNIQKAYLLFPAARAVLTKTGSKAKGYPIKFKFEVDPKNTPCTFVLNFKGALVISKPLEGSPTGSYQVSILIRKPGLYTWQVKTAESESELREVTIKD